MGRMSSAIARAARRSSCKKWRMGAPKIASRGLLYVYVYKNERVHSSESTVYEQTPAASFVSVNTNWSRPCLGISNPDRCTQRNTIAMVGVQMLLTISSNGRCPQLQPSGTSASWAPNGEQRFALNKWTGPSTSQHPGGHDDEDPWRGSAAARPGRKETCSGALSSGFVYVSVLFGANRGHEWGFCVVRRAGG